MDPVFVITLLYVAGLLLLIMEVMLPSHGLLTVASLTCFGFAIYQTFQRDPTAGAIGLMACVVMVPTMLLLGIKYVRYLPMGDRLAPPNPDLPTGAYDTADCKLFVGTNGTSITPLRPVGTCDFHGQRITCVAESGMIDAGIEIIGVEVRYHQLVVRPAGRPTAAI